MKETMDLLESDASGRALARTVGDSAERLAAFGNEHAAAGEQVRAAMEAIAAGIEDTAQSVVELVRSQHTVSDTAASLVTSAETSAANDTMPRETRSPPRTMRSQAAGSPVIGESRRSGITPPLTAESPWQTPQFV